ncbi:hypothetical protein P154DRAFT_591564, partial [Amniculicola lignicola CBS 123094]
IHHRLCRATFPACLQVAFATLTSYIHRTPSTTDIVLEIVEDRSKDLIRDNQVQAVDGEVDLLAQLSRLHALMVYQMIGLHDGDVRSWHVAESHFSTQGLWTYQLLQSAGNTLTNSEAALGQIASIVGSAPGLNTPAQQQWFLWILSESLRRTWLTSMSISTIHSVIQQGSAPCPGNVMFTNRSGLWDAESATEWEKRCADKDVAFLQRLECTRLFDEMRPEDVDEYGLTIMDMTFHSEVIERWKSGNNDVYA